MSLLLSALALASFGLVADDPPPVDRAEVDALIDGGLDWFVQNQNEDGSWGTHHSARAMELIASVPGTHRAYRSACTALGITALNDADRWTPERRAAADKAMDYLLGHYDVHRPNGLEFFNIWTFAYGLQAFSEWLREHPEEQRADAIRAACRQILKRLETYQCLDGGFGYLDLDGLTTRQPSFTSMGFTTATVLIGIERARNQGIRADPRMVERALRSVRSTRTPLGVYTYGPMWNMAPASGINREAGAACRSPQADYALSLFGDAVPQDRFVQNLDHLLVEHVRFQRIASRRPIPHESWYAISGYFYLFGHAYAAYVLEAMPAEVQERLWPPMVDGVKFCHQPDGSFWDYPVYSYHKPYGTAFAVMALSRVPR